MKKVLCGCGVVLLMLLVVAGFTIFGLKVFQWIRLEVTEEQERQQFAESWQSPQGCRS